MARWDDDRRRTGEQGARGDDRWAGRGEPWPGRGQLRNRDDEGGERSDWEGRPRERAWAEPGLEGTRAPGAGSAGSRDRDWSDREGWRERARAELRARSEDPGAPSLGDEAGGWRRSTQFSPTGEGPGSYGPESEQRRWRSRPLGRGPKNYRRSDARIHEDLAERFATSNLNTEDVELSVEAGVVTLSGRVETLWDKRSLEEIAEDTFGVTEVQNRLRIDSPMDRARRANRVGDDTHEDLHQ